LLALCYCLEQQQQQQGSDASCTQPWFAALQLFCNFLMLVLAAALIWHASKIAALLLLCMVAAGVHQPCIAATRGVGVCTHDDNPAVRICAAVFLAVWSRIDTQPMVSTSRGSCFWY
jgi:hypothetical protein